MLCLVSHILQIFKEINVIGENQEEYTIYIAPKAPNAPYLASSFDYNWGIGLLIVEGCSTNVDNGEHRAIREGLLKPALLASQCR